MTIVKTVLEHSYEPRDFFEAAYRRTTPECEILADGGKVTVTLTSPEDPLPEAVKSDLAALVEAIFRARQLRTHHQYQLGSPTVNQHSADGGKSIVITPGPAVLTMRAGTPDVVISDSAGNVIHDSKAERIAADARFVDELAPKISRSPLLRSLVNSYGAAVKDPANELVHLYEIRDALAKHYKRKQKAIEKLGIPKAAWQRLGELADSMPLQEGRHRGWHVGKLRPATQAELDEARDIALRLIMTFGATVK